MTNIYVIPNRSIELNKQTQTLSCKKEGAFWENCNNIACIQIFSFGKLGGI